ncbi:MULTISPECIES: DedA family protein [unclassified Rhodococcus (in: high G+C Gram-positive bacteria)]|uniref:DedA family protein n=1 Tax=unclassified Rhodococcus (in: high G+C Gram-positive bacteria) TaxID=192944 RepID=UPI00096A8B9B|nr:MULTISPECIES: DedA family protein [unclassified Rhodococcus (in: high G+C Gram-positive bacteria)]
MTLALTSGILNPDTLLSTFGLIGLLGAVFIETGLLFGFFLPGDSLLFTAGVLVAQEQPFVPLWVLLVTIPIVAVVGDQCGYLVGRAAGPAVFDRPGAKRLGPDQLARAEAFFEKHGPRTVVLARFVPVIRTITPVMAGTSRMPYRTFLTYNVIGGLAWGVLVPVLGYMLGGIEFVRAHIEIILIAVVVVSILPIAVNYLRSLRVPTVQAEQIEIPE